MKKNRIRALFSDDLPRRAEAVVNALHDARTASTPFLLSCGLLPELSEACTEGLHDHVHGLSERHLNRRAAADALDAALRRHGIAGDDLDDLHHLVTTLLTADITAAYLFGLAAGLGLGSLDERLSE